MQKKDIIPHPFTFHMQVRQDPGTQAKAASLQMTFAQPDVVAALNSAQPQVVYYARILQIPNNKPDAPQGIFAIQVVVVYQGPEITPLYDFFWNTPALRALFQEIQSMAVPIPEPDGAEKLEQRIKGIHNGDPATYKGFCDYLNYNNITPLPSELHRGYNLTVEELLTGFTPAPPVSTLS